MFWKKSGSSAIWRIVAASCCKSSFPDSRNWIENWKRPKDEVGALMGLLEYYLKKELETFIRDRVQLRTIGRTDELSITVYVPEDRIGDVVLGQTANVSVDSFPGIVFKGVVSYISDQAEFTPRNVETVSGRKNTVFAVKLTLSDIS